MPTDPYFRRAKVQRVIDGDTIDLVIDLGWDIRMKERVRLIGVDAPEVRGAERPRGLEVKSRVVIWCAAQEHNVWLHSRDYKSGKYGRTLGMIYSDDQSECLNDLVLAWSNETEGSG